MADGRRIKMTQSDRFWSKVEATEGCWPWHGSLLKKGYGLFSLGGRAAGATLAHIFAYREAYGAVPVGLQLDHTCRNRACVNPHHLEPVTAQVNVLRGVGRAAVNAKKTHCIHGHEFTPENTGRQTNGRMCMTCRREYWAKQTSERREARSLARTGVACG